MAVRIAKQKPEWLTKIAEENREAANRAFEGRCKFVTAYLEFLEVLEEINDKYNAEFTIEDVFEITPEDEQKALDMLDGEDDDDDE
jgi:hypothetical protein